MEAVEDGTIERVDGWRATRTIRIALAGCGAVGSAVVRELADCRESLAERHGVTIDLCAVLVRDATRARDVALVAGSLGVDVERFIATETDVLIEAIGGIEPARRIVESALRRGTTVITANKALLAAHGTSLEALARRHGAVLRYDAAVGGGVPILRLIDDALGAGTPRRVRGIFNGTANFILTGLERGQSFDDVLALAQAHGFAESDCTRDLGGHDAADKLAIVAWAAYDVAPETVVTRRVSLLPQPARYTTLAERLGCVVRQICECTLVNGAVVASVEPVLVARGSAFACTVDEQNRVEVHTGWSAPLCASGPGAGGVPTATALLSDLLATRAPVRRDDARRATALDGRPARWAIEAVGSPSLLHQLVPRCGLVHTNATADISWTIVDDLSAAAVDALLETLTRAGACPIAARFDDLAGDA